MILLPVRGSGAHGWLAWDWAGRTWVADWIAGVGQAAGAIGTFIAVAVALHQGCQAEVRRRQDAADRENARVMLVSSHVTRIDGSDCRRVVIRNDSAFAIFNVELTEVRRVDSEERLRWGVIDPPDMHPHVDVIEARGTVEWVVANLNEDGARCLFPSGRLEAVVSFVDYEGVAWVRSGSRSISKNTSPRTAET